MSYVARVQQAINYIEEHLEEKLILVEVARAAHFSRFHFCRIFRAITGESVGQYVSKRRLNEACRELLKGKLKILDIAINHGFESQAAFSRAFKRHFGLTPGMVRRKGNGLLHLTGPLTIAQLTHLQGGTTMKPTFRDLSEFTVVGMAQNYTLVTNKEIPKLWDEFIPRFNDINARVGTHAYGLCQQTDTGAGDEFRYTACVEVSALEVPVPEAMISTSIPAKHYAIFRHKGSIADLKRTYDYIYGTWLPKSSYEVDGRMDFEFYGDDFNGENPQHEDSVVEIFVPVRKKV